MFTWLLSLWVTGALLLPLSWGSSTDKEDYDDVTSTPDYDYNFTFDYYFYNGTASVNYDQHAILDENSGDTKRENNVIGQDANNQGNKDSSPVYRHYIMLTGLLVLQVCQLT